MNLARHFRFCGKTYLNMGEFGLDVETSLLRHDQKVSVGIDKGGFVHALIRAVYVCCDALTQERVTRACHSLHALDKVHAAVFWDIEGQPCELSRRHVHTRVERQEVTLDVFVIRNVGLPNSQHLSSYLSGTLTNP